MKKVMHCLFLSHICSTVCCFFLFFLHLFLFIITKIKNGYIVIINIVINIKKGSGGNDAMLLGDFALKPSENFNMIFLRTDFVKFKWV